MQLEDQADAAHLGGGLEDNSVSSNKGRGNLGDSEVDRIAAEKRRKHSITDCIRRIL